jgi:outer membrane biosynthesis protein TonB
LTYRNIGPIGALPAMMREPKMRTSTAYFAGVGTVIVAVGAGLGGGYLAASIVSPPVQTVSKLERRMSAEPVQVTTAPAEPVRDVASPTPTDSSPSPVQEPQQAKQQPSQQPSQPSQVQRQPQTQPAPQTQAAAPATNAPPAEEKTNDNVAAGQPAPPAAKPVEQADDKTAASRDSYAKANDVDIKRAAAEKRRVERRKQWADKRRGKQPREQLAREQELDVVENRVREATEPRIRIREAGEPTGFFGEPARRDVFAGPARSEPRIRLFDDD